MDDTNTKTFQHFKFTLPILKTRTKIVKDESGNEVEKRYVEGVASSTDLDLHGDRMDPSAIESMAESLKYHVVRLNAEHDTSWQSELGDISRLDVSDDNRLLIEAELNDMSKAKDLWYALNDLNKKLGLSIGGYVKEYEMVKEELMNEETSEMESKWVRHYKNIELDHIAVTSSPANPKTWVGAIAKSIQEDSKLLAKKLEEEQAEKQEEIADSVSEDKPDVELGSKDKHLKEMASKIVKAVQNLEADLLLELTYAGLHILSDNQIVMLDNLIAERGATMNKDISLEADETVAKQVETEAQPEGEVETPATLENESKEGAPVKEEGGEPVEEKPAEEGGAVEAPAEAPVVEPTEVTEEEKPAEPEPTEEKPATEGDESKESGLEEGVDNLEGDKEEVAPAEPEAEKPAEDKPADEGTEKSIADNAELMKSIQDLTGKMSEILKTNEALVNRVKELENQPASRKTVELDKNIGDNDEEVIDSKSLKEEMEAKIAQVRKDNFGNPNLFAMVQKIRADYSKKIKEQN